MAGPTPYRCTRCGGVERLPFDATRIRPKKEDGAPSCATCGRTAWVQVGTTTEFYAFWQREDVCRLCEKPAEGVREHRLVPQHPIAPTPGHLTVESITIRACPKHVAALRAGWDGFVLRELD